MYRIQLETVCS